MSGREKSQEWDCICKGFHPSGSENLQSTRNRILKNQKHWLQKVPSHVTSSTWIFKKCWKIVPFFPMQNPTKRQTFYIFGRSRYGLISIISGISLGRVRSLPCHTQRFSAREIPCFPSWHLSEMITKSLSRVFWTKCEISHPKGGKVGIHGWFGGWWNFIEFFAIP